MYESFFELDYRPFAIPPEPECIFWASGHRDAFSVVERGLERRSQVTMLTGDIGSGKTTLIRHLLETALDAFSVGLVSNVTRDRGEFLPWVLSAFDQDVSLDSDAALLRRLERHFADELGRGRRSVLVVDEAQNLSTGDLETLRLLGNLNAAEVMLMLVIVGRPELRKTLMRAENKRICRRIAADHHLAPLTADETAAYVRDRIARAGGARELFDAAALAEIHASAAGLPGRIDILCDLALGSAHVKGAHSVDHCLVRAVIEDAARNGIVASLTGREPHSAAEPALDPPVAAARARTPRRRSMLRLKGGKASAAEAALPRMGGGHGGDTLATLPQDFEVPAELFGFSSWSDDTWIFIDTPDDVSAPDEAPGADAKVPLRSNDTPDPYPARILRPVDCTPITAARPNPAPSRPAPRRPAPTRSPADLPLPRRPRDETFPAPRPAAETTGAAANSAPVEPPPAAPQAIPVENRPASAAGTDAALRRAFAPQLGWRRRWGSAAGIAALAAAGSVAAGIAFALLPDANGAQGQAAPRLWRGAEGLPAGLRGSEDTPRLAPGLSAPSRAAVTGNGARVAGQSAAAHGGGRVSSTSAPPAQAPGRPDLVALGRHRMAGLAAAPATDTGPARAFSPMSAIAIDPADVGLRLPADRPTPSPAGEAPPPAPELSDGRPGHAPAVPTQADLAIAALDTVRAADDLAPVLLTRGPHPAHFAMDAAPVAITAPGQEREIPVVPTPGRIAPLQDPLELRVPEDGSDASPAIGPRPAPVVRAGDASEAEAFYLQALDIGSGDPQAAAIAYARAALLGHARAAYYLGQIYETGDGVPIDFAMARHWYQVAAPNNTRARARLAGLAQPERGTLATPLPLLAAPIDGAQADFVWTSGPGADPVSYVLEISAAPRADLATVHPVSGSAARLPLETGASHWRVLALDPLGGRYSVSDWRPIRPAHPDGSARMRPAEPLRPAVTIAYAGPVASDADRLRKTLGEMGIQAELAQAAEGPATSSVGYFYGQDGASADAIAALLPGKVSVAMLPVGTVGEELPMPGALLVTLGSL